LCFLPLMSVISVVLPEREISLPCQGRHFGRLPG